MFQVFSRGKEGDLILIYGGGNGSGTVPLRATTLDPAEVAKTLVGILREKGQLG